MQNSSRQNIRPWTFAGIMLSYWCNARCRFCYVGCGPEAKDWVVPAEAVRWWRELVELAHSQGKTMQIHLSGGEPFGNWPVLLETAQRAHAEGLTTDGSFQKVETNGFWATSPEIVRERIRLLSDLGMRKLAVSADPHHQEFVDPQCVRTCVETAREILGPDRVQVRWLDWYDQMQDLRHLPQEQRNSILRKEYEVHRERLTGRAAFQLAGLLEACPTNSLPEDDCHQPMLASRHVHIDPYGNVFPGVCAGIILGNARQASIAEIYNQVTTRYGANPVLKGLISGGPQLLLRYAQVLGFAPRLAGYVSKCHLCTEVRRFLFEKNVPDGRLGPAQVYASGERQATPRSAQSS